MGEETESTSPTGPMPAKVCVLTRDSLSLYYPPEFKRCTIHTLRFLNMKKFHGPLGPWTILGFPPTNDVCRLAKVFVFTSFDICILYRHGWTVLTLMDTSLNLCLHAKLPSTTLPPMFNIIRFIFPCWVNVHMGLWAALALWSPWSDCLSTLLRWSLPGWLGPTSIRYPIECMWAYMGFWAFKMH